MLHAFSASIFLHIQHRRICLIGIHHCSVQPRSNSLWLLQLYMPRKECQLTPYQPLYVLPSYLSTLLDLIVRILTFHRNLPASALLLWPRNGTCASHAPIDISMYRPQKPAVRSHWKNTQQLSIIADRHQSHVL